MLVGRQKNLIIPIESYSKQLIYYLHYYLDALKLEGELSAAIRDDVDICLRWEAFPNDKEIQRDFKRIQDNISEKTHQMIKHYNRCIMTWLGRIAECVIVDRCTNDLNTNIKCMNIAVLKSPYEYLESIPYEKYIPFSPSFKYIFYTDEDGFLVKNNVPDYNPNHPSKDIAWCNKYNIMDQYKLHIPEVEYVENARLQVKTSICCEKLNLDTYLHTPVVCFDLNGDVNKLKAKYPNKLIYSINDIDPQIMGEIDAYFKIFVAYVTGMISKINIREMDIKNDRMLEYVFRTPVKGLLHANNIDITGILEMINIFRKPIIMEA